MAEEKKRKHAGHGYKKAHITHHHDGSATAHYEHEDGPDQDRTHAVADLDGLHDSMQDHLGTPNPGEAEADAGQHGVSPEMAGPAGLPTGA